MAVEPPLVQVRLHGFLLLQNYQSGCGPPVLLDGKRIVGLERGGERCRSHCGGFCGVSLVFHGKLGQRVDVVSPRDTVFARVRIRVVAGLDGP